MKKVLSKIAKNAKPQLKLWHIIIIVMALFALFNSSLFNVIHNKMEIKKLTKRNIELDEDYKKLEEQLAKLEAGDKEYLEYLARTKYHLSKPAETEFRFKNPKDFK
ncbi:cell division protein FtsB [Elusimicrobium posterum]|uniref:FtsB family cell division protein n=1 Tax=Elusimicrobium posterum TaxID=3116653 RepID=UPI003C76B9C4